MKKKKKSGVLLYSVALLFLTFFFFELYSIQNEIDTKKAQNAELEKTLEIQNAENNRLSFFLENELTDEIIESFARDLGYARYSERIYIDVGD